MILRIVILVIALFYNSLVCAKEIAFSFDDAPRAANGYFDGPNRAANLIKELNDHQIKQAAFFATTQNINLEGAQRLHAYAKAGHIIANHTHTHPDINKTALSDYISEISQADKLLSPYATFKPWFRFPYLREGDTLEKRDGVRAFLSDKGYFNAYITLNNYDWHLESLFQNALKQKKKIDMEKLKALYVDVIMQGINYYDELAVSYLKRSPKHILLLHETDLNALFVGELANTLRANGWRIIDIETAYQDDIATYSTQSVMKYNPGRIGEIAKDNGQKKQLWHRSMNTDYLDSRFEKEVIVTE